MMKENDLKKLLADNLQYYRKLNNYTQAEIAEILNYTDKAVSKWERAESIPDLLVINQLANLYKITIDDLLKEERIIPKNKKTLNNVLISMISAGIVWLVATIVFVALRIALPDFLKSWLAFIYAIPVSMIVLLVFTNIWGDKIHRFITLTIFYWTIPLSIFLSFDKSDRKLWLLFIIVIPIQVITILYFFIIKQKNEA